MTTLQISESQYNTETKDGPWCVLVFLFQPLREANFANYVMVWETKKTQEVFQVYSFHRFSISHPPCIITLTPSGVTTGWILFTQTGIVLQGRANTPYKKERHSCPCACHEGIGGSGCLATRFLAMVSGVAFRPPLYLGVRTDGTH